MVPDESVQTGGCEAAVVHARVAEVQDLFNRGNHEGVIADSERFAAEFGSGNDAWVIERAAYVLLLEGISLTRLDRGDQALAAFGRLQLLFGNSSDPDIRDHAARGMINRAQLLDALGRKEEALATYDALIARYHDDPDRRVGRRVSWAIWNKTTVLEGLNREAEREDLYDQLADRHDEGVDFSLDSNIAWCIQHRAWKSSVAGDVAGQIKACDAIVRRFDSAKAPAVRRRVLDALLARATALAKLGEREAELSTYDEIATRFAAAPEGEIREGIVEALRRKGVALGEEGRHSEAITTLDAALAVLAEAAFAPSTAGATKVLLSKGVELGKMGRAAEAIVVFDSAFAAYRAADHGARSSDSLVWTVMALTYKVENLCRLDRSREAETALDQLVLALGDVEEPAEESDPSRAPEREDELARAFADVIATGECWRFLDPPLPDAPQQEMAERAVNLYRLTEPWVRCEEGSLAAQVAAGFLRDIADGYALLAKSWSAEELARLPLPERAEDQRATVIRRFGIDDWLAERGLGHLSEFTDNVEDDGRLSVRATHEERDSEKFWAFFLSTVHNYGLRLALRDSPSGRQILHDAYLRDLACLQLGTARRWVRWLGSDHEVAPAAVLSLFIAQGSFMTSYTEPQSSHKIFPSKRLLREMLDDVDFRRRLEDEDGVLPTWLWDPAADSD